MECAGRAQRRRRFSWDCANGRWSQSGVALRLPPHSKSRARVRVKGLLFPTLSSKGGKGESLDRCPRTPAPGNTWPRRFAACAFLFLLAAVLQWPASLFACGPNFPNNLLDGGDAAVLVAPVTDFIGELQRMKLVESKFQALPFEGKDDQASFATQAAAAELTDLAAALKKAKVPDE